MNYLIFVKKNDPAIIAALSAPRVSKRLRWDGDPIWNLLEVNRRLWRMAREDTTGRAFVVPALTRTMRQVPQKYKDYLTARGVAWQDSDSILDALVELTGNEDLGV